ncbi:MAG: hypothetical protein EBT44_06405, partial [Actinobacteria bacterium]|nr:hypothetical protein [Candidatus Fonsibacter lacus]
TGTTPIYIGSRGGGSRFQGSMYELRYWNVARSASEIVATMNSALTGNESGLVANYTFNQGTAGGSNAGVTTATSTTGTNSGTLSGFALTGTTSNWIEASAGSSSYTPTNTSGFTIYAQWSANTNVVTYDVLGGSAVNPGSFVTGGTLTLPAAPTLAGSTFVGWFLATTGGSASFYQ